MLRTTCLDKIRAIFDSDGLTMEGHGIFRRGFTRLAHAGRPQLPVSTPQPDV